MVRIRVDMPREQPCDVVVEAGCLGSLGSMLKAHPSALQVMVVTDAHVPRRYLDIAKSSLERAGYCVSVITVPAGERAKSTDCAAEIWNAMAECALSRDAVVVALGGGVVGDLAAFAASTYLCGLRVVQVPTTLLSMADPPVGGRAAINLDRGRNLVGTSCQPIMVCADSTVLETLPEREWACGCAEIAKSAAIGSEEFFFWLSYHAEDLRERVASVVEEAIGRCVRFKASVVARDREGAVGVRECLGYGHMLAHAIEAYTGYGAYSHGHALAQGMRFAARLSAGLHQGDLEWVGAQDELLDALGLPEIPLKAPAEDLLALMRDGKEACQGKLRFVLPASCGRWQTQEVDDAVVLEYLRAWVASHA